MIAKFPDCKKFIDFFSQNWMTFFETEFRFKSHEATDDELERID